MRTIIVAALGAFGGTLGYAYILNAPKNTILPASFIGLAGYMAYVLLGMAGFGTMSAYFLSTVLVSVVCELLARKMRTPATIFLLSALVPLVPGYNFYLAMLALVENRGAVAAQEGMVAVQIVAAIAARWRSGEKGRRTPQRTRPEIGKPQNPDGFAGKRQEYGGAAKNRK